MTEKTLKVKKWQYSTYLFDPWPWRSIRMTFTLTSSPIKCVTPEMHMHAKYKSLSLLVQKLWQIDLYIWILTSKDDLALTCNPSKMCGFMRLTCMPHKNYLKCTGSKFMTNVKVVDKKQTDMARRICPHPHMYWGGDMLRHEYLKWAFEGKG